MNNIDKAQWKLAGCCTRCGINDPKFKEGYTEYLYDKINIVVINALCKNCADIIEKRTRPIELCQDSFDFRIHGRDENERFINYLVESGYVRIYEN